MGLTCPLCPVKRSRCFLPMFFVTLKSDVASQQVFSTSHSSIVLVPAAAQYELGGMKIPVCAYNLKSIPVPHRGRKKADRDVSKGFIRIVDARTGSITIRCEKSFEWTAPFHPNGWNGASLRKGMLNGD